MTERGNTYEEIPDKPHKEQSSSLEVQQSSPATYTSAANVPVYASPSKATRGVPQELELFFPKSYVPLYATPNRTKKATGDKSMALLPHSVKST